MRARSEILQILDELGDEEPLVKRTVARGIVGVRTGMDPREVIERFRALFDENPFKFRHTVKWVPVDMWTRSTLDSMKEGIIVLRREIHEGERWRMTVQKRRHTRCHKIEIIRELANLIDERLISETQTKFSA